MIYSIMYEGVAYEVDDEKSLNEQDARFIQLWQSIEKTNGIAFSFAAIGDAHITVYDMGGIIISISEKEVGDGK